MRSPSPWHWCRLMSSLQAHLQIALLMMGAICRADSVFGIWKMDAIRSTFAGDKQPRSFTVRIDRHEKGEVFTLDRIEADGRSTSSSTILYLDSVPRGFQGFGCSGSQSSRAVDKQAVEITRKCQDGAWTTVVRRSLVQQQELIFDIAEHHRDGRRFDRRLVFKIDAAAIPGRGTK